MRLAESCAQAIAMKSVRKKDAEERQHCKGAEIIYHQGQNQNNDILRQILGKFYSMEKILSMLENQLYNSSAKKVLK